MCQQLIYSIFQAQSPSFQIDLGNDAATYNTDNDISWDKVKQIVQRVHQSGIMMPVIVDNGIVCPSTKDDSNIKYDSNIKKLAGLFEL